MFYDFVLTKGHDRGSIMPVRKYKSSKLSEKVIGNVNTVIAQAFEAINLLDDESEPVYLEFGASWVDEKSQYDETFSMLLAYKWFDETIGELKTKGARGIAKQILDDLASTEDWDFVFEGASDAFSSLDFDQFSFVDNKVNNDNLKVPIGEKVYVRGCGDTVYTYQGRPTNSQIQYGANPTFTGSNVWATDSNIMKIDNFSLIKYAKSIETFPLPTTDYIKRSIGKNRYFSRVKGNGKATYETFGKTQKEAKTALALILAFDEIRRDDSV